MKRKILTAALLAALASTANASVIEFKGSLFGGTDIVFDNMDLKVESGDDAATVIQTDTSGDGTIIGPDAFLEFGGTSVVGFTNNGSGQPFLPPALHGLGGLDVNYSIFFDYAVSGMAQTVAGGDLEVTFDNLISAELYVMWDADASADGSGGITEDPSWETRVDLATFTLAQGNCDIDASIDGTTFDVSVDTASSCSLDMIGNFMNGYFTHVASGQDLEELNLTNPVQAEFAATVQEIDGLNFFYPVTNQAAIDAAIANNETPPEPIYGTQEFNVGHDSNMSFVVPEPSSIAILGLGLLGLARIRRKS